MARKLQAAPRGRSNKRMHATRDTLPLIYNQRCGRARDARR